MMYNDIMMYNEWYSAVRKAVKDANADELKRLRKLYLKTGCILGLSDKSYNDWLWVIFRISFDHTKKDEIELVCDAISSAKGGVEITKELEQESEPKEVWIVRICAKIEQIDEA